MVHLIIISAFNWTDFFAFTMGIVLCRQEIPKPLNPSDPCPTDTVTMTHLSVSRIDDYVEMDHTPGAPIYVPVIPGAPRKNSLSPSPRHGSRHSPRNDSLSPRPGSRPRNDSLSPRPGDRSRNDSLSPRPGPRPRSKTNVPNQEQKQNGLDPKGLSSIDKLTEKYGPSHRFTTMNFYSRSMEENKYVINPEIRRHLTDSSFQRHEWAIENQMGQIKRYVVAYVIYDKVIKVFPRPRPKQNHRSEVLITPMDPLNQVDTLIITDSQSDDPMDSLDQLKARYGEGMVTQEEFTPRSPEEQSFITKIDEVQVTPLSRNIESSKHSHSLQYSSHKYLETPVNGSGSSEYERRARRFSWNISQRTTVQKSEKENVNNENIS